MCRCPILRPGHADKKAVDALVLITIVAASTTMAVMGARGMLIGVLHVMAHPPRPSLIASEVRASMRRTPGSGL